ncbi:MAG: hypothetical protein P8L37_04210 [Phycisphaerales bacterium]|nr:hypothetical protein [Phycisphaerales bacterium]
MEMTRAWIPVLLALLMLVWPCRASHPHVSLPELVHTSHVIIDGRIDSVEMYEEASGRILTDVTLRVLDVWHSDPGADAHMGSVITWTIPGGVVHGRSLDSVAPRFEFGERVVVFALLDGKRYIDPFVGGQQGVFRIQEADGVAFPMNASGRGMLDVSNAWINWSPVVDYIKDGQAWFRPPARGMAEPRAHGEGVTVRDVHVPRHGSLMTMELFKQLVIDESLKVSPQDDLLLRRASIPGSLPPPTAATWIAENGHAAVESPSADSGARRQGASRQREDVDPHCWCGSHDLYIAMKKMPEGDWSNLFNSMSMGHWNRFMDVFREIESDGSWAYANGVSEFCGFYDSIPEHGEWGTALAAVLISRKWLEGCDSGSIYDADVLFNSNVQWVSDFNLAYNDPDTVLYQRVVNHELGHVWGFHTQPCDETYMYSDPSVMGFYNRTYVEDGRGMHTADAEYLRLNYLDQTLPLEVIDVGCESYRQWGSSAHGNATTSATEFVPGDPITISGGTIENMSTNVTNGVRARYYLSTDWDITTDDIQLPGFLSWDQVNSLFWWTGDFSTTIPDVVPGAYFVGLLVTTGHDSYLEDAFGWNNSTWLPEPITILPARPSNDACQDAQLVGASDYPFDTTSALTDGYNHLPCGDGDAHGDVWYRYQAEGHGVLIAHTCGSASFDTMLAVYEDPGGCPPGLGSLLECNDDNPDWGCGNTSLVSVQVVDGQDYLIRLGAAQQGVTGSGTITLLFIPSPPASNDDCSDALSILDGDHIFDTTTATTDGSGDLGACTNGDTIYNDVWFSYTVDWDGQLDVSTCDQADFDTLIAVYRDTGVCPPASTDLLVCNDDGTDCSGWTSDLSVQVSQGDQLLVRVGSYWVDDNGPGTLSVELVPGTPANDDCASALEIAIGDHVFNTAAATTDGSSHLNLCDINGQVHKDIWYTYGAPCSGTLTLSTCDQAEFDTDIVVYDAGSGCTPGDAEVLACNDVGPGCGGFTSELDVPVTAGQQLLVRIGGFSAIEAGIGTLSVSLDVVLPHDNCAAALPIGDGEHDFDTTCASTDGVQHDSCQYDGQIWNDLWFRYVATCDGELTASTCDLAGYDTDMAVYADAGICPPVDSDLLACNDDADGCSGYTSEVVAQVTEGQPYLIRVGGWGPADSGTGTLLLYCYEICLSDVAPLGDPDGMVDVLDLLAIIEMWGTADDGADINNDGIVDVLDLLKVIEAWGPCA